MREAFTDRASKFWNIAADKLAAGFANESEHLRVAILIVLALYVY